MRYFMLAVVATIALVIAGGASAHNLTVTPPGAEEAVFDQTVSQGFAQAHCRAQSPEQATANSGGTVVFTPATELPCPPIENPGGQTTGP